MFSHGGRPCSRPGKAISESGNGIDVDQRNISRMAYSSGHLEASVILADEIPQEIGKQIAAG
jgi:hypothetical protein